VLQAFTKGVDKEMVCLMAARASRMENQDAIDAAIVGCLADPKEVRILPPKVPRDPKDLGWLLDSHGNFLMFGFISFFCSIFFIYCRDI